MLFRKIKALPHQGKDPTKEFVGKNMEKEMAQIMKEKFRLVKTLRGYDINSIDDQGVCFTAHIFAGKIMSKCVANQVHVLVAYLAIVVVMLSY